MRHFLIIISLNHIINVQKQVSNCLRVPKSTICVLDWVADVVHQQYTQQTSSRKNCGIGDLPFSSEGPLIFADIVFRHRDRAPNTPYGFFFYSSPVQANPIPPPDISRRNRHPRPSFSFFFLLLSSLAKMQKTSRSVVPFLVALYRATWDHGVSRGPLKGRGEGGTPIPLKGEGLGASS